MKKVLMLHGWNNLNYTKNTKSLDAWDNRSDFLYELAKKFEIYKLNFPGFCGEPEPDGAWTLDDYATFVKEYLEKSNLQVDYIIGYSFGGAVAVKYALMYDINQKLILLSPAITRNQEKSKRFFKTPQFLDPIRNMVRDFYLIHIIKNPYMVTGDKFLNASYQNIVRIDLIDDINNNKPSIDLIIYGEMDYMVNPSDAISRIDESYHQNIIILPRGGHDIANSHIRDLMIILDKFK